MSQELRDLYKDGDLTGTDTLWADWLGTWILEQHRRARQEAASRVRPIEDEADEYGPAYAAFLKLPDVTGPEQRAVFEECCAGSFNSLEEIALETLEELELTNAIEAAELEQIASYDTAKILRLTRQTYDIVEHEGRFYRFMK